MHLEALTEEGKYIFAALPAFDEFYLAGGTALALQIGHRVSVDFDLFTDSEIPATLLPKVKRTFTDKTIVPSVNNKEELTVFINETKVTFLWYPFPVLKPLVIGKHIPFLAVKELAATKAYTIGRRGAYKDYVDMYTILTEKYISLEEVIHIAGQKYGDDFNDRLFLEQLTYFDDITDTEIQFLTKPISRDVIKLFFEQAIKNLSL